MEIQEHMNKEQQSKYERRCFVCGTVVCWDSSCDRSESDDAIVDYYHCPRCGTAYEVYWPNEEEQEEYKEYWTKR